MQPLPGNASSSACHCGSEAHASTHPRPNVEATTWHISRCSLAKCVALITVCTEILYHRGTLVDKPKPIQLKLSRFDVANMATASEHNRTGGPGPRDADAVICTYICRTVVCGGGRCAQTLSDTGEGFLSHCKLLHGQSRGHTHHHLCKPVPLQRHLVWLSLVHARTI